MERALFDDLLTLVFGVFAILSFPAGLLHHTDSVGDHEGQVNCNVAQAGPNEPITEEVARLGLANDVCEAPQMIRQDEQCAVVEEVEEVRLPRLQRHIPKREANRGERREV